MAQCTVCIRQIQPALSDEAICVCSVKTIAKRLDESVLVAYGWKSDVSDGEILEKLPALNLERAKDG